MEIVPIEERDVAEVARLETRVWGDAAANQDQIRCRAETFREGSLIARTPDGLIIAYVVTQRVDHISTGSWTEQTNTGRIVSTHRPNGRLLYGVNLSVLPQGARWDASKALIEHCYGAFVAEGLCSAICLGSRVPGFARWARRHGRDIRSYLNRRDSRHSRDPELRIYERNGFRLLWEMEDYFEDPDSLNYGAMIIRR